MTTLRRTLAFWPLLALCVLLSVRWMFADAWPSTQSTRSSEATAALLGVVICAAFALRERGKLEPPSRLFSAVFAGALLFAGLNPGLVLPNASPKSTDLLISFSLTPIVIAVALVAAGDAGAGLSGGDLLPGLAAGAGLLVILPQPSLTSFAADGVLLLAPVCIGVGVVWLGSRGKEPLTALRAAAALCGATVVFGALALKAPRTAPAPGATGLDLAVLLLTLLALQQIGVWRSAAQFAAVPLLLLLEGLLLNRVRPTWQQVGGLLLLVAAVLLLLRSPQSSDREESPRLFP